MRSTHALSEEPVPDGPDEASEAEAGPPHAPDATDWLHPRDDAHVAELLTRIVHQDDAALAALYRLLSHRVRRAAQRMVGEAHLADVVVEDTFWQVWRQAPRFDPLRGSGMAWVMTIARSRALGAWRRQQRQHAREHCSTDAVEAMQAQDEHDAEAPADLADWLIPQRELERLLSRVRQSVETHRIFHTIRRSEGNWDTGLHAGLLSKLLRSDAQGQTLLLRVEAGHPLPWPQLMPQGLGSCVVELLVLSGALRRQAPLGMGTLGRLDYLLVGLQDAVEPWTSMQSTLLLVRISHAGMSPFGEIAQGKLVRINEQRWAPLRQGVSTKVLQDAQDLVSMLVWFEPGATVPAHAHAHAHAHDEECLMVDGELFLGDILLLEGEYQLSPKGSSHADLSSDVGCIVFFHGSVDPAVEDKAWCEAVSTSA